MRVLDPVFQTLQEDEELLKAQCPEILELERELEKRLSDVREGAAALETAKREARRQRAKVKLASVLEVLKLSFKVNLILH